MVLSDHVQDQHCHAQSVTIRRRARSSRGFTYIGLLIAVALMGIGLASIGTVWHTAAQREREAELLFVGEQFQQALASYFNRSPEAAKTYPPSLEALLEDQRSGVVVRHLRKVFVDPITMGIDWGLVRDAQGRIIGVHSLSRLRPFRRNGFGPGQDKFEEAKTYAEWIFAAAPAQGSGPPRLSNAPGPVVDGPKTSPLQPVPVIVVDPKAIEEDRARLKEACESERQLELNVCTDVVARLGAEAKARCEASVQARFAVCLSGTGQVPPPLFDGTSLRDAAANKP